MWLTRNEEISHHGEYPGSRSIEKLLNNGIVFLDKWCGPTSHDVTSTVKKTLGLNKAGHAGTLDPMVSGMLPIVLGNATKAMPLLQKLDKEYMGIMKLHKNVSKNEIKKEAKNFVGRVEQTPPVRSAVKREKRKRLVYSFDIIEKEKKDVLFKIKCEAGLYVRKLVHDLGNKLGGAHMSELRRISVGTFRESRCIRMQQLAAAYYDWKENGDEKIREFVLPVEVATENVKKIIIKDSAVYAIAHGSPLYSGGVVKAEEGIKPLERIAILTLRGELAAIGSACVESSEMVKSKKMATNVDRVIIDQRLYPKMQRKRNT